MVVGRVSRISGPLVVAEDMSGSMFYETVAVGEEGLIGEIIGLEGDKATIQVYEDTTGLMIEEKVVSSGKSLTVELGPGIIGMVYDGLQRPLIELERLSGGFLRRGVTTGRLSRERKWHFKPTLKKHAKVTGGDTIGLVMETSLFEHRIMIPPDVNGELEYVAEEGEYLVEDTIATVGRQDVKTDLKMYQEWPVRKPRPCAARLDPSDLLTTGVRVVDCLFPIAKGGKVMVPGGFGTGKTVLLQDFAKWTRTHVNILTGCGERGNEIADALTSFLTLKDSATGVPLSEKTVFISNTSNMPVAARETSILVGMTIAEYIRDMGYDVLLVADSTSRWAEAMREIAGRLEEMPGEEGFPAYLGSKLAEFYERSGVVKCLGSPERTGSVTTIGAVSPPGGDFSEPVTQATMRIVRALLALDVSLANQRHFPAISWLSSYSLYGDTVKKSWSETDPDWSQHREKALDLLQQEARLQEIVRLVGPEALPAEDRLTLEVSKMIREDFLMQSAYNEVDAFSDLNKTSLMLMAIIEYHQRARETLAHGVAIQHIMHLPIKQRIARMKEISKDAATHEIQDIISGIKQEFSQVHVSEMNKIVSTNEEARSSEEGL
ncbi:MAG: V-type ATP synthase subunit A [archaeon]